MNLRNSGEICLPCPLNCKVQPCNSKASCNFPSFTISLNSSTLTGAQKLNEVSKKELQTLIVDKDRVIVYGSRLVCVASCTCLFFFSLLIVILVSLLQMSAEMKNMQKELTEKRLEMKRLQEELIRRDKDESNMSAEYLKSLISALEKDNANLKVIIELFWRGF